VEQILGLWNALDMRRRVIVAAATLGMFAAVLGLARLAATPSMSLLYAGLDPAAAGEVIAALDQRGIAHEVRGDAIFVPAPERDGLRMVLAGEGLPANSTKGYELLDGLSGFGTTSQMFDAAYWRAKEGELARTILAHPGVSAARVHLASTGANPFQRDIRHSASVSVTTGGQGLSPRHARALQFLVASARCACWRRASAPATRWSRSRSKPRRAANRCASAASTPKAAWRSAPTPRKTPRPPRALAAP
jgi:flagellar M-ring protein FliF